MQCTKILHLKVCKCELESTLQDFLFSNKRESKIHVHVNTLYNVRQNTVIENGVKLKLEFLQKLDV